MAGETESMDGRRKIAALLTLCAGCLAIGSGCNLLDRRPKAPPLPAVLPPGPSLSQVIDAVNNNSRQIQSFSTAEGELSGPGIPVTLRGTNIAFERPRRLRIRAGTGLTGSELDVGSNDELFWFWIRRNNPPAVFFCRHNQFASCAASRMIPMEPAWLIEAFGIVELATGERHEGPFERPDGQLEIVSIRQSPCGDVRKKTVIDRSTAVVLEQHLYDQHGRPVASAVAREHRRDPLSALIMPRVIDLQCPQAQFSMRVNLGNVAINQPFGNAETLWTMPTGGGWPLVDLADPNWPQKLGGQPQRQPQATIPEISSFPEAPRREFNRLR
jgi:hypothetical protein